MPPVGRRDDPARSQSPQQSLRPRCAVGVGWYESSREIRGADRAGAEPPAAHGLASGPARIVSEAWKDPAWGLFVWMAMTSGARRGELCALRWNRIDFGTGVLTIR